MFEKVVHRDAQQLIRKYTTADVRYWEKKPLLAPLDNDTHWNN